VRGTKQNNDLLVDLNILVTKHDRGNQNMRAEKGGT